MKKPACGVDPGAACKNAYESLRHSSVITLASARQWPLNSGTAVASQNRPRSMGRIEHAVAVIDLNAQLERVLPDHPVREELRQKCRLRSLEVVVGSGAIDDASDNQFPVFR